MNHTLVRAITALTLVGVAAIAAYLGLQYFIYLTHIFILLLQIELGLLLFKKKYKILVAPFVILSFASTLVLNYLSISFLPLFFISIVGIISVLLILYSHLENLELQSLISNFLMGFLYVGVLSALTTKIMLIYQGIMWLLLTLAVVFSGDVAAYFVGRKFGAHKVFPTISPNKSWEGAIGGLVASVIIGTVFGNYLFPDKPIYILFVAAFVASLLAQSGDFFESLLKRISGNKDSGVLLPGHGGFLDRFDGILFAIPIYYYLAF